MGQHTLILMCLNRIFYHYINPPVAKWVVGHLPETALTVLWVGCTMTMGSMAAGIPLIYLFNRWLPQLAGQPMVAGPLLKNLI